MFYEYIFYGYIFINMYLYFMNIYLYLCIYIYILWIYIYRNINIYFKEFPPTRREGSALALDSNQI